MNLNKKNRLRFQILIIGIILFVLFTLKLLPDLLSESFFNKQVLRFIQNKSKQENPWRYNFTYLPIKTISLCKDSSVFRTKRWGKYYVIKRCKHDRTFDEMEVIKLLKHENIVDCELISDEIFKEENFLYIKMEYLPIKVDVNIIRGKSDITKQFLWDVSNGIKFLHDHNIIHQDLKFDNIMGHKIDGKIRYKIIDFGFSMILTGKKMSYWYIFGTYPYIPPDWYFYNPFPKKGDIWSFGIMATILFYNKHPNIYDEKKLDIADYENFCEEMNQILSNNESSEIYLFIKGCIVLYPSERDDIDKIISYLK